MDTQTILICLNFLDVPFGKGTLAWQFGNCDLQIAGTWSCHLILKQVLNYTVTA